MKRRIPIVLSLAFLLAGAQTWAMPAAVHLGKPGVRATAVRGISVDREAAMAEAKAHRAWIGPRPQPHGPR